MTIRALVGAAIVAVLTLFGASALAQSCPAGYPNYCGNNLCCPSGYSCGGSCGANCCGGCPGDYPVDCGNGSCCPSGTYCSGNSCVSNSGSGSGSGSGNYSTGSYSSQDSGMAVCQDMNNFEGCDLVQACANGNGQAWYNADGSYYYCSQYSCSEAAQEVTDYCDSKKGCSVASPGAPSGGSWALAIPALVAAMAFVSRRRRRAAKAAALVIGSAACGALGTGCVAASGTDTNISVEEHQQQAEDALRDVAQQRGIAVEPAVEKSVPFAVPAKALSSKGAPAK